MKTMTYKGYSTRIEHSDEDGLFITSPAFVMWWAFTETPWGNCAPHSRKRWTTTWTPAPS